MRGTRDCSQSAVPTRLQATRSNMFKLILLLATVAYASAGLYTGYGGPYGYGGYGYGSYGGYGGYGGYGYGLGHGVAAIAPAIPYAHAPIATSYANTYKVAVAPTVAKLVAPAITKVAYAPAVTKLAYTAPAVSYAAPAVSYGHYGYTIPPSVTYTSGLGYGHGYGGLGYGYGLGYGHGYGYGGYGGYYH